VQPEAQSESDSGLEACSRLGDGGDAVGVKGRETGATISEGNDPVSSLLGPQSASRCGRAAGRAPPGSRLPGPESYSRSSRARAPSPPSPPKRGGSENLARGLEAKIGSPELLPTQRPSQSRSRGLKWPLSPAWAPWPRGAGRGDTSATELLPVASRSRKKRTF
jgi:hypothetical protein